MEKGDQELIDDYAKGDSGAFARLVDRHAKRVYNFVYRLLGNRDDAEDVTQETFLKIWKNLKKFRTGESFSAWLLTIAHNTAIDSLRKRKNVVFSDFGKEDAENIFAESIPDPEALPDELAAKAEDAEFLEKLLEKLPILHREVLLLHYKERLTFDQIGKILKKPLDTVKSQHRRALVKLRGLFDAPKSGNDS
jgi:RNA polymerase sigma-70 factor (ECF subfamily)